MSDTLDEYLRKIPLGGKDVAVVGPNHYVNDDPSLLYFANRMANQRGTLTVLDAEPHHELESHGNIEHHMKDLESMVQKGVRIKHPCVVIGDVTETELADEFDIIYETGTFKCIVNLKAAQSASKKYVFAARKVLNAYHQMLRPGGIVLLVYPDCFQDVGYSVLHEILRDDSRFEWGLETGFKDSYRLRNLNRDKVALLGKKRDVGDGHSTPIHLDADDTVTLGSRYANMHIIVAKKIA